MEHNRYLKNLKWISKMVLIALMTMLVLGMFLGTIHLSITFIERMLSSDPYYVIINVEDLYVLFSILLIIVVGYELLKSMLLIFHHDSIPVKSIVKIAAIATANKIITLNLKDDTFQHMAGMGILLIAAAVAFFFFNQEKIQE